MRSSIPLVSCLALALLVLSPAAARGDAASAELLFREGKRLLAQKQYDEACPKLAESHLIDPATGTLLALALCYERSGKTASAWAAYNDAAGRASAEKNPARERAARGRAAALEPGLSRLTIEVPPGAAAIAGVEVKRDGSAVGRPLWGSGVPVDPGEHTIAATAPGRRAWQIQVSVGPKGDAKTVTIEGLDPLPPPPRAPKPARSVALPPPAGLRALQIGGIAAGGAGLVGLGVGTVFVLRALSKNSDSKDDCEGNVCGSTGTEDRRAALAAGDVATVGFIAGGVLAATGLTLFLVGRPAAGQPERALRVTPILVGGAGGLVVEGRY